MFDLQGKVTSARVFAETCEGEAIAQIHRLLDHPAFVDIRVRIMPDVHAGAGCVIGFTASLGSQVVPNLIGVDIGCGVAALQLDASKVDFDKFDRHVRKTVPSGFSIRSETYDEVEAIFEQMPQRVFSNFNEFSAVVTDVATR